MPPVAAVGQTSSPPPPGSDPDRIAAGDILLEATAPGRGLDLQAVANGIVALPQDRQAGVQAVIQAQVTPREQGELSRLVAAATPSNVEGFGAFGDGFLYGDFSKNTSWSATAGQIVGGLIPIWGQAADLRDTVAAIGKVWNGEQGGGIALGAAVIGWVPLVGDAAKSAIRVGARQADNVLDVGGKIFRAVPEQQVVNALQGFQSVRHQVGGQTFLLSRTDMQHMLQRHHPSHWDGSVKATQSFLDPRMSIDDVSRTATSVLNQNRDQLTRWAPGRSSQFEGVVDGQTYVVGINADGHIRQLYPK